MPRKICLLRCFVRARRGFNGAEAVMPRKIYNRRAGVRARRSFNGAEAVMPRKILGRRARRLGHLGLQWGRGSDASEDLLIPNDLSAGLLASMGPRQ